MMGSFLQTLKSETSALHERIEGSLELLQKDAGAREYTRFLERLFGFHDPLEARLMRVSDLAELDLPGRLKAPLLRQDLLALGRPGPHPRCHDLPDVGDAARALGCLYVLEGSTLGNQVVRRLLERKIPQVLGLASTYLRGHGAATRERWVKFGEILENRAVPAVRPAMLDAARETFVTLERWLSHREEHTAREAHA